MLYSGIPATGLVRAVWLIGHDQASLSTSMNKKCPHRLADALAEVFEEGDERGVDLHLVGAVAAGELDQDEVGAEPQPGAVLAERVDERARC